MSPAKPFFSIVIPTRNRGHLLRHALQSALDQTFDDYEVVVSDNCSRDDTAQVVDELKTARVRYVRPDRALSMPDHWEFALGQATGEHMTYLCDDDALCPTLLEHTAKAIEQTGAPLTVTPRIVYYSADWNQPARRNCALRAKPCTWGVHEHDSRGTIRRIYAGDYELWAPRMLNSFCRRDLVLKAQEQCRPIFCLAPDFSFTIRILLATPKWALIDRPLRVWGMFQEGVGASAVTTRGPAAQQFVKELGEPSLFQRVPFKAEVLTNYLAETLLIVKGQVEAQLAAIELDRAAYFVACWRDLLILQRNGQRVEAEKQAFFGVLVQQPADVQKRVRRVISRPSYGARQTLGRLSDHSRLFLRLANLVRQRTEAATIIWGDEAGFTNILECARRLDALWGPR